MMKIKSQNTVWKVRKCEKRQQRNNLRLRVSKVQLRDRGFYHCQLATHPPQVHCCCYFHRHHAVSWYLFCHNVNGTYWKLLFGKISNLIYSHIYVLILENHIVTFIEDRIKDMMCVYSVHHNVIWSRWFGRTWILLGLSSGFTTAKTGHSKTNTIIGEARLDFSARFKLLQIKSITMEL